MRNAELYNIWNDFINCDNYSKYFNIDNIQEWSQYLMLLQEFIDNNNIKPSQKTNKQLHTWMQHQVFNFNHKTYFKILKLFSCIY